MSHILETTSERSGKTINLIDCLRGWLTNNSWAVYKVLFMGEIKTVWTE
jgi:hypothetical protein